MTDNWIMIELLVIKWNDQAINEATLASFKWIAEQVEELAKELVNELSLHLGRQSIVEAIF